MATFCCQSEGCNYKAKRKDHLKIHYLNLHGSAEYLKQTQDNSGQCSEAGAFESVNLLHTESLENNEAWLIISHPESSSQNNT